MSITRGLTPDDEPAPSAVVLHVHLEADSAVRGTLRWDDRDDVRAFQGWLELMALIEQARASAVLATGRDGDPSPDGT